MNLAGEDLLPDRSHVFYLEIPKEWKTQDLGNPLLVQVFFYIKQLERKTSEKLTMKIQDRRFRLYIYKLA